MVLLPLLSRGQADTTNDSKINYYLNEYKANTLSDKDKKELIVLILGVQNKGFRLEEVSRDYRGALAQINRALSIWTAINDTAGEANLLKYKGYLLGHLSRFPEAKAEIHNAITLYTLLNMDFGVAVSQFDLSQVYELEMKKLDSAKFYAQSALAYWKTQKDTLRIFLINNELICIFNKLEEYDKSEKIQKESQALSDKKEMNWRPLIDYYFLSYQLFEKMKNYEMAGQYKKLYLDKIAELRKQNMLVKSSYDTQ
jgi:tetratricopeptide (TPR) repeat protein